MKKIYLVSIFSIVVNFASAQTQTLVNTSTAASVKTPALDKSPLDVCYFPVDYPVLKTQSKTTSSPLIRVIYSRPQKDNRTIFGELIEYNKVWRLGANEATEIEFFKDAVIAGKKIAKGRYTLYAIPTETKWTIILNRDTDVWGAFAYDLKKDVLRTDVSVATADSPIEAFSISFNKIEKGAFMLIAWDKVSVSLPIEIK